MALKKRGDKWLIRIRMDGKDIKVTTEAKTKRDARRIDQAVQAAVRSRDFSYLDSESRSICVKLFQNRGWDLPGALVESANQKGARAELTLWKAIEIMLKSPTVRDKANRVRHEQVFAHHIVPYFGKDYLIKDLWVPQIQEFMEHRISQGAAGSTVNKDKAALSRMFKVLMDYHYVSSNPAKMVDSADESDGEREVYVSFDDFCSIMNHLPIWVQPIIQTLYFTGMRRGEVLSLTRDNVDLDARIIRLHIQQTKERRPKTVPIHRMLIPAFERVGKVRSITTNRVFLTDRGNPPSPYSLRKPWVRALQEVGLSPGPTIHDLRHVWSTNAMRSGIDSRISERILGHALKKKDVSGRYLSVSDEDLIRAIDRMRFDHGETKIWLNRQEKQNPEAATSGLSQKTGSKRAQIRHRVGTGS